jgi:hypothetical protein
MWQSYRDNDTSTFYFVYDDTRDDRLGIVVVDVTGNGIVLTDKVNTTGKTLDPYTGELTYDSKPYMKYLREKGIDTSKLVKIPKSPEEQKEHEELGVAKNDFDWFIALSHDYKSKYIGRAHRLTDEQFDYLWNNKFNSLLTQYVKTGLLLSDHQIDKIATDSDLKKNYLHNRIIADQHSDDLTDKEFDILNPKQKETFLEEKIIAQKKILTDSQFDYLWNNKFNSLLTQYVKTGLSLSDHQIDKIATDSDLKKNYIHNRSIADQHSNNLTIKEYSLFSVKQKESYYNNMNDDNKKLDKAIKFDDSDFYKYIEDGIMRNNKNGFLILKDYHQERMSIRRHKISNYYGHIPEERIKQDDEDNEKDIKKLLELLIKPEHRIMIGQLEFQIISLLMQSENPIQYKNLIPNDIIKNIDHYEIERLVRFARKPIEALEVIGKEIVNDKIRIEIFNDLQKFDNEKKLEGAKILLMFTDFLDDRQINFVKKCIEKSTLSETNKEEIYNLIEKYKTS